MVNNPKALWDNCLSLIKSNVNEQQYNAWFAKIAFESYNEETRTLLVQVPSRYVYEVLEQHYVRLLSWALANTFGEGVQLTYRNMMDVEHQLTIDEEGSEPVNIDPVPPRKEANKSPNVLDSAPLQEVNPQLNLHKTFQSFIEGDSNKLPRTVGLSVAEHSCGL